MLLACDKGYGSAEYRMHQFYKDSNPVLAQQLLVRAVLHAHEEARTLFKSVLKDLDLSESSLHPYLKAIVELIVAEYVNEGMNATHSSWNHPDLLWHLYTEKASPEVFAFLQRRLPNYIEESRDEHLKTLLHRLLEDWDQRHDLWFQAIFDLALNGLREADVFDGTGSSLLDISCMRLHTNSFQQLIKKGAKKLKLDQLDAVAAFYMYLKHHPEADQEAIKKTLEAFKQLEESNRYLKFRMALEHLLGGPLTKQGFSSNVSMVGTQSGNRALPLNIFQEGTRLVIRANTEGRATVAKATAEGYSLYFKFFPELPGIEQAVSLLTYDLLGFGTTLSELFNIPTALQVLVLKAGWVTGESLVEETVENIPVLVSLGIEGCTLKQVFENPIDPATQLNILENLDEESLHALMLVAMLTNPEDGKGDNYIAEPFITHEGQTKYRIVGIDNDHAFVPPLTDAGSNRVRINTKTILYAFDQITKPIPENVRTLFTSLDLDTTLRSWLSRLRNLNGRYAEVFRDNLHNQMLFDRYRSFIGVPFGKGALAYLYSKFIRLRQALASHQQRLRPLDLFMVVEPFLSGRYGEEIRQTTELSAFERFKRIEGQAATKTLSRPIDVLTSYHIPSTPQNHEAILRGQQYNPGQATDELEEIIAAEFNKILPGQLESFRLLKRGDQIETALEGVDFGGLSFEENVQFLKIIQEKLPLLHRLILRNHQSFKTAEIKKWTADVLKGLTHITLSGCQGVDQDGFIHLAEQADNLVYLDVSGNATLRIAARRAEGTFVSSLPLTFKNLSCLDVSNCKNLSQLDVEASRLEVFNIENNPELIFLIGIFPKLRYLDMRGTRQIDKAKMANFMQDNPFFFKDGHLEIDERNPNAMMIKEAQQFFKGKLIYRPNADSDEGKIEMLIADLANPLEGEFNLKDCGNMGEGLSINTGYRKSKKAENKDKAEIWFVPKFMVERDLGIGSTTSYLLPIIDLWPEAIAPIGIFWSWGNYGLKYYDYLTSRTPDEISSENLYENWHTHSTSGQPRLPDDILSRGAGELYAARLNYLGNLERSRSFHVHFEDKQNKKFYAEKQHQLTVARPLNMPIPVIATGYEEEYRVLMRGKLIYKPDPNNDTGRIEMFIADMINPETLEGEFDLEGRGCDDAWKCFSINTGYRKSKKVENKDKVEIWFVPRFLVEKDLQKRGMFTSSLAKHLQPIMDKWPTIAPIGIFWTWGGFGGLGWYDYLTDKTTSEISKENLNENWKKSKWWSDGHDAQGPRSRTMAAMQRMNIEACFYVHFDVER